MNYFCQTEIHENIDIVSEKVIVKRLQSFKTMDFKPIIIYKLKDFF